MKDLNIRVEIEDDETCSRSCAFLDEDDCLLFNAELRDTVLLDRYWWQDGPTKQRHHRCMLVTE